ncbi:MAG: TIGR03546 family protein [Aquificae bacterium]|nr:TIGR03546 family protein [Aquificota bacterium]
MNYIFKLLKALNSNQAPWQISLAFVLGMILGFLPFFNFFSFFVIVLAFVININISMFILSSGVFATIGLLLDPVFDKVGYAILTFEPLIPLWTFLYNIPYVQWTGYNNTVVMGSLAISLLLAVPIFFITNRLIIKYREKLAWIFDRIPILRGFKIFKFLETFKGQE